MTAPSSTGDVQSLLMRLLWLSVAAAVVTIGLKTGAWLLTDSVGLLSDALESVVNLVAAVVALMALRWAHKPADEEHLYGHAKAEYFSAVIEGVLIILAALAITVTAVQRLRDPAPLEDVGVGVAVAIVASAVNLFVAILLIRQGRRHRSITLEADGRHLLTDVWTSVGVVTGVVLVPVTGWERLDPILALAVALNITVTGVRLVQSAGAGLMDRSLSAAEHTEIDRTLDGYRRQGIAFHALRTRRAGRRAFISVHLLAPGDWTIQRGHDLAEEVEAALRGAVPHAVVFTHLEPLEDPRSFQDTGLDRSPGD